MLSETLLREAAEHSLRSFLEPNAIFLAELLHTSYPSAASSNLLATAHLRQGNFSLAADVLRHPTTPDNRYLYAVCQARINTPASLREAEAHLRSPHLPLEADLPSPATTPGGAAGLYLLANICHRTGRKDEAIALYCRAAAANPTLWLAFDALAAMGIINHVDTVIPPLSDPSALERLRAQPQFQSSPAAPSSSMFPLASPPPASNPPTPSIRPSPSFPPAPSLPTSLRSSPHPQHHTRRATSYSQPLHDESSFFVSPSPLASRIPTSRTFADPSTPATVVQRRMSRLSTPPAPFVSRARKDDVSSVRNPTDLFATPASLSRPPFGERDLRGPPSMRATASPSPPVSSVGTPVATVGMGVGGGGGGGGAGGGGGGGATAAGSGSGGGEGANIRSTVNGNDGGTVPSGAGGGAGGGSSEAMTLIRAHAQIAAELGRFRCVRAVELTNSLPQAHRNSGLILSVRGRAFLEKGDFFAAEMEFARVLHLQPSRMDGVVEYYSTVLWHLRKEKQLAQLAIRSQKVCPVSASAWCAAGNCFSLQHDPDTAIKFFKRAIAVSRAPNAYAHTLCGHEYVVKEDFDAALDSFRNALHIDSRHYNAMYGIGQVLQKQEKFELAQSHFRNAVQINPRNSSLHYHLGVALAAAFNSVSAGQTDENGVIGIGRGNKHALVSALAELETAANLDPQNPVPRFERAKILVTMNRLGDARGQLEELRDSFPKEAEIHFELSRVCQRMGDGKGAVNAVSVALDIEPKERKYKKALETFSNELETSRGLS